MKTQVKELLQEYLKRVLVEKPDDPIDFLIGEIKKKPFTPPPAAEDIDTRSEEQKSKSLDLRREETKMDLLKDIFDRFDPKGTGQIARAKVLVAFKTESSLLLSTFPKHVFELPRALEHMDCGNKEGLLSWQAFSEGCLECLASKMLSTSVVCTSWLYQNREHSPHLSLCAHVLSAQQNPAARLSRIQGWSTLRSHTRNPRMPFG